MQLTSAQLPKANKHCGGYMYSRETSCVLNGVATPCERIFSKGPRDTATPATQLQLYLDAPIGAILEVTNILDPDQYETGDESDETTVFKKVREDLWEEIPWPFDTCVQYLIDNQQVPFNDRMHACVAASGRSYAQIMDTWDVAAMRGWK